MSPAKPKIIVILGPTATGKSDLAVRLAKQFSGEVISADSRQVYKGLDIGTGKITKKEMQGIPHHLLNVCDPKKQFTIAPFQKLAQKEIRKIINRGRIPIICGGTGFYIQSIVDNIILPEVPPNSKLRKNLEKKTTQELFSILKKLDPVRASNIDKNNPRRLIRAIEIAKTRGTVPSLAINPQYESLQIGLTFPKEVSQARIKKRLIARLKTGMIAEAKRLHMKGLSFKRMEALGLEYRFLALYLQGKISKKEMIEKLNTEIWHYAKRQMTWFQRDKRIKWFNPVNVSKIKKEVSRYLSV